MSDSGEPAAAKTNPDRGRAIPAGNLVLESFLDSFWISAPVRHHSSASATGDSSANPATIPVLSWGKDRHAEKLQRLAKERFDLLLIGNSITHFWGGDPQLKYANGEARQPNGPRFLAPDGTILPGLTSDFTHPTDKGYQIWADAIRPFITAP